MMLKHPLWLMAMGTLLVAPVSRAAAPEIVTYTVQQGDSIWSVAEEFYGDGRKYPLIYRYNSFSGKPPHLLKPGQVLRLPVGEIGPEAQVRWLKREVKAKPPRSLDWLQARERMNLWRLYKVSTGDESAAHILFEDESDLRLRENALLVIYGATASKTSRRRDKTRIVLEQGTLRGGLQRLDADSAPLSVETRSAHFTIFGKLAQIQAEMGSSSVSVYDGKVRAANAHGTVDVPVDFGTVVKRGAKPQKPRPLPARPRWAGGAGDTIAVVPGGQRASFEAAWLPAEHAHTYRVEIARDQDFTQAIVDVEVGAGVTRFRTPGLKPGLFFARVATLDSARLESRPSKALKVRVTRPKASRALIPADDGVYEAVGLVSLSFPEVGDAMHVAVDDGAFASGANPIRLSEPGLHTLRFRPAAGGTTSQLRVRLLTASADIERPPGPVSSLSPPVPITLRVSDERGRPAVLPGLVLEAAPGGELPLDGAGAGTWTAELPIPEGFERVALRARWLGGALAIDELAVTQPVAAVDVPRRFHWPDAPLGIGWQRRSQATRLPSIAPQTLLGLHTALLRQPIGGTDVTTLGLSVLGALAVGEDLALDAALTAFRPEIAGDAARANEIGDVRLGARYRVLDDASLALAPSLRVTLPTGGREEDLRQAAFEPGVLVRLRLAGMLTLDTRQAVVAASDFGDATSLVYAGTYAVWLRPTPWLGLTAHLDTALSLSLPEGADRFTALALGGGVSVHLDRVRLGLLVGGGVNGDGRRELAEWTGSLTLEIGYGGPPDAPDER